MDFTLSKEQRDVKRAAAKFARGEFTTELAQECEFTHRFPRELYKKAGELDFIGIDYPENVGGKNLGVMENLLIVGIYEGTAGVRLNNIVPILKKLNIDFIGSSLL